MSFFHFNIENKLLLGYNRYTDLQNPKNCFKERSAIKLIGISLSYDWLLGDEQLPPPNVVLPKLREHGVRSIEIRMVPLCADPNDVLRAADILWDFGFNITVHSEVKTQQSATREALEPLSEVISHLRQKELTITIHPIVGDNVAMLISLSDYINEHGYPVRIALENERKMPDRTDGDSLSLVLDAVKRADRDNVGICFDMGHLAWYNETFTDSPNQLPPKEFLARVIHTHIHACVKGSTHFPLDTWRDPFASYITALSSDYSGVYNVELMPKRFAEHFSAMEGYLISADTLCDKGF